MLFAVCVVLWLGCGAIAYAMGFAELEAIISRPREHRTFCAWYGVLFGPIALAAISATTGARHGLKWW